MVYYAKSPHEGGNQVTNQMHLREVLTLARHFGNEIYMSSSAWIAGLLHDFGKYSQAFQDVLRGTEANIDHAICAAVYLFCAGKAQKRLSYRGTAKGRSEHSRVHDARVERRGDQLKLYEYTVFSDMMQVWGKCDCIEAHRWEQGCKIKAADFLVSLYPIEYKHGSVREERSYMIQLCAQAICLEEMFSTEIPCGALFFTSAHRRMEVEFTDQLRSDVSARTAALRKLWETHSIPPAEYSAKCRRCSIQEYCMPKVKTSAGEYCRRLAKEAMEVDAQGKNC